MPRPELHNVNLHLGSEEYPLQIERGVRKIEVNLREESDLRMSFTSGGTFVGPFKLIRKGSTHYEDGITTMYPAFDIPIFLYFRCPDADHQTVEVIVWR